MAAPFKSNGAPNSLWFFVRRHGLLTRRYELPRRQPSRATGGD